MKNKDPKTEILRIWEALDEETQEAIRVEINLRARKRFDANFKKEEASALEDLKKGYMAQGFSKEAAQIGAQEQLRLEKLLDVLKVGLQTKDEGWAVVSVLRFIRSANLSFLQRLTQSGLNMHDLFEKAGELIRDEGQEFLDVVEEAGQKQFFEKLLSAFMRIEAEGGQLRDIMRSMARTQKILQDTSSWKDVKGRSPQEAEKLNRTMLEEILPAMRERSPQRQDDDVEGDGGDSVDRRNN